jgi:hypothetical protein
MTTVARRMFELLEPICLVTYLADECNEEFAALGRADRRTRTPSPRAFQHLLASGDGWRGGPRCVRRALGR